VAEDGTREKVLWRNTTITAVLFLPRRVVRAKRVIGDRGTQMKTSRRLGWFVVLFMMAVTACSTTVPPRELIERNDHGGLTIWYEQEAARLQGR